MSIAHIAAFVLFMLPIVVMPGPDFALVTSVALKRGRLDGIFASIGVAVGVCFWGFVSVLGLAAVLQFLDTDDSTTGIVVLAAVLATIALVWFCTYAVFISAIRPHLQTRRARRGIEGATGLTLTGMGVRLALETR
jgi:threonine/homoserine/homoserine lactone efflux protein